jgi:ATP-dependent Clp protease adaptor protein ClpS
MSIKQDTVIEEKVKINIDPPRLWKVMFMNDNVTPMELVIDILISIFKHDEETAKKITLEIHNKGSGIAGIYPFEIAEHFALEATNFARKNGSPLKIQVEQE